MPVDPEHLAALLDGALSAAGRKIVREQLAAATVQTIVAYEDAVAIVIEMTGGARLTGKSCKRAPLTSITDCE